MVSQPAIVNSAIEVDYYVIANAKPVLFVAMYFIYSLDCHRHTFRSSGTVYNDLVDAPHASPPSSLESMTDLSSANLV